MDGVQQAAQAFVDWANVLEVAVVVTAVCAVIVVILLIVMVSKLSAIQWILDHSTKTVWMNDASSDEE